MKNLKLLNKKILPVLLFTFFFENAISTEPVDIWNLENKPVEIETEVKKETSQSVYQIQSENNNISINQDQNLLSKNINIIGIYDPSENDLSMDMWKNSNGIKILEITNKIQNFNLSNDANGILNIALLTNSYFPEKNISSNEFLKIKSDWLIKYKNFNLIEQYLEKNKNLNNSSDLIKYYLNYYLSKAELSKACEIFDKINNFENEDYVLKFNIYCLLNSNKISEAQLKFDLSKELGFKDTFFEKNFAYLIGYEKNINNDISQESLLDFHLSHRTNSDFKFEPNLDTPKLIWKYLSSSNLLQKADFIDLEDQDKIFTIEKATHDKNYEEDELFAVYERFMFNINQLLTIEEAYKLLPKSEARALVYQGILLNQLPNEKIKLIKLLKDLFEIDNITNAFDKKLVKLLDNIEEEKIPSNYTNFYNLYSKNEKNLNKKIKFNNKIIHQSKLLNYFKEGSNKKNIEDDLENLLKKIKKDKNYFFSIKDMILIESLKSEGIQIPKKYQSIYEKKEPDIPYDIQILISKNETGLALLRLVEIIGEDRIIDLDPGTLYFIISTLNQLNIDKLRNNIILKVLPLKV